MLYVRKNYVIDVSSYHVMVMSRYVGGLCGAAGMLMGQIKLSARPPIEIESEARTEAFVTNTSVGYFRAFD